jgi:3-deoxy-7-phosphoheptulonate synthase
MILQLDKGISPVEAGSIFNILKNTECRHTTIDDNGVKKIVILDGNVQAETFLKIGGISLVTEIKSSYKLSGRECKSSDTIIKTGNEDIGGGKLTIIAGPCAVESRQQLFDIASSLKEMGINIIRGGVFKPRTSPYSFQGLQEKGLEFFLDVKRELNIKVITEVLGADKIGVVSEVADIIQVGSRNMQNYPLLTALGKIKTPVFFKRGMAATINEYLNSAEYILAGGNPNVILCERGIKTFETATRNTLDLNAVPVLKEKTHLPVFVDPSHGIGIRNKVIPMALAGIACGADGLIVEVHNDPDHALSDGSQSLTIEMFKELLVKAVRIGSVLENVTA